MVGFFFLVKGLVLPAAILMMVSFVAVLGAFLYSDTRNWRSSASKSLGQSQPEQIWGRFQST